MHRWLHVYVRKCISNGCFSIFIYARRPSRYACKAAQKDQDGTFLMWGFRPFCFKVQKIQMTFQNTVMWPSSVHAIIRWSWGTVFVGEIRCHYTVFVLSAPVDSVRKHRDKHTQVSKLDWSKWALCVIAPRSFFFSSGGFVFYNRPGNLRDCNRHITVSHPWLSLHFIFFFTHELDNMLQLNLFTTNLWSTGWNLI